MSNDKSSSNKEYSVHKLRTREEVVQDILRSGESEKIFPLEAEEEEIRLLAQSLRNRKGSFGLHFAVCDDNARQHELTIQIASLLPDQRIIELDLIGNENSLLDTLASTHGVPDPLIVYGMEKLLPQGNELALVLRRQDILQEMQMRREQFRSIARPLLLWMPEYVYTMIGQQAVDFWSWQGGAAFFATAAPPPYFSASGSSVQLPQFIERNTIRRVQQGFIGRSKEVENIIKDIRNGQNVLIYGPLGIGKTDLAMTVADQLSTDFPDARLYVPLGGSTLTPETPNSGLQMIIQALNPSLKLPNKQDELIPIYISVLEGKRVLLVIDDSPNAETTAIFTPPRKSSMIVTSRSKVIQPGMNSIQLGTLRKEDARNLLKVFDTRIKDHEADEITYLCGYTPVALRLAGGRLAGDKSLSPTKFAAELRSHGIKVLATSHESLVLFFNRSYNVLDEEKSRVFRGLAVFFGVFDSKAEEFILNDPGNKSIQHLVQLGFVNYDDVNEKYYMSDLLRQFAISLSKVEERRFAFWRCLAYYHTEKGYSNEYHIKVAQETFWAFLEDVSKTAILRRYRHLIPIKDRYYQEDLISSTRAILFEAVSEAIDNLRIDPSQDIVKSLSLIINPHINQMYIEIMSEIRRDAARNRKEADISELNESYESRNTFNDYDDQGFEENIVENDYRRYMLQIIIPYWQSELKKEDFDLVYYHYLKKPPLSIGEIARVTQLGESTVRIRIRKVLQRTRSYLEGMDIFPDTDI